MPLAHTNTTSLARVYPPCLMLLALLLQRRQLTRQLGEERADLHTGRRDGVHGQGQGGSGAVDIAAWL